MCGQPIDMNAVRMRPSQKVTVAVLTAVACVLVYKLLNWVTTPTTQFQPTAPSAGDEYDHVLRQHPKQSSISNQSYAASLYKQRHSQLSMTDLSPAWSLQPDFVHRSSNGYTPPATAPLIPRIIHQVWDTTDVPPMYEKWIQSWTSRNPGWQHWFWTLDDVRNLISWHYPEHLTLYDSYTAPIFRADVMRYFVLHKYGGVYVDLDMESLRPLDDWAMNFYCLVSEENYEHAFIVREQPFTTIMNGFIACSAGHPFLELAIDSLDGAALRYFGDYLYATGPHFFNEVYLEYSRRQQKHVVKTSAIVTVLPPYYFLPTYDPSESEVISGKCSPEGLRSLPMKSQFLCRELAKNSFHNTIHPLAYANHYWIHAYMFTEEWKRTNAVPVTEMAPKVKLMSSVIANPQH